MSETSSYSILDLRDEQVVQAVFREHYTSLVSFAFRYLKDQDLSEEMVQDVFTKLWTDAEKIKIQTSVKSYLLGAVRNACLNLIKHQKVQQSYAQNEMWISSNEQHPQFLEYEELKSKLDVALGKLPEKCREIFELNRFEGKRYKEIAEELKISLKTVENQMGKALKIMRDELVEYLPLIFLFIEAWG